MPKTKLALALLLCGWVLVEAVSYAYGVALDVAVR